MNSYQPRVRMFAGPNGSGKTTIKTGLDKPEGWFGLYINPDDIERAIREDGGWSVGESGLEFSILDLQQHFAESGFLQAQAMAESAAASIRFDGDVLSWSGVEINSYHTSVLADFLRRRALRQMKSFSFETVMSAPDKVKLLRDAQAAGYRTYLYFVATESPEINVARVKYRVTLGGHDVPTDKIIDRYYRSLSLLPDAVRASNRAYFFDTSEQDAWYFASCEDGRTLELESDEIPAWFGPLWESF